VTPVIDIHIHIQPQHMLRPEALALIRRGRKDYAEIEKFSQDPAAFLKHLDLLGIERAGLINYVSPGIIGFPPEVNDWCANYCAANPERLIAFGGVDPATMPAAGAEVDRLARIGIRGLKLHPPHQAISPNAYRDGCRPLAEVYERAQANRLPVMVHTGTSIFPGARNLHAQPLLVDDVSIDYPDLVVILAHGGRPLWMEEAFFLVRRHKNMYMDISGIPPLKLLEYFPRIEEVADKVLWGTDWPGPGVPEIRRNMEQFRSLPISESAKSKILYDNAARLFPVTP
jgi:predicted TIM-barrel fold metal-dependent hydrolase